MKHLFHSGLPLAAALAGLVVAATPAAAEPCDPWDCGTNSPTLYGGKLRGLNLRGLQVQGLRLVQGSLTVPPGKPGSCTPRARMLGIIDGELIGIDPASRSVLCTGDQLEGAYFRVGAGGRGWFTFRVWITDVGEVSTWELDPELARTVKTYRLAGYRTGSSLCTGVPWFEEWQISHLRPGLDWTGGPIGDHGGTVLDPPSADDPPDVLSRLARRSIRTAMRRGSAAVIAGVSWAKKSDHALVYQGEIFDQTAGISHSGPDWFSLACARHGLAKMRLLGFDPMATGADARNRLSSAADRVATARMITARYDGTRKSHTVQGVPLLWLAASGIRYHGDPDPSHHSVGPVEATWSAAGARCLSHLRTSLRSSPIFSAWPEWAEAVQRLQVAGGSMAKCGDQSAHELASHIVAGAGEVAIWTTYTVDHIRHRDGVHLGGVISRLP